jgi:Retrotransposon gag protein
MATPFTILINETRIRPRSIEEGPVFTSEDVLPDSTESIRNRDLLRGDYSILPETSSPRSIDSFNLIDITRLSTPTSSLSFEDSLDLLDMAELASDILTPGLVDGTRYDALITSALLSGLNSSSIEKPPRYTGSREGDRANVWLTQVEMWLASLEAISGQQYTDRQKVVLTSNLLDKDARAWWTFLFQSIQEDREDSNATRRIFESFEDWKNEFLTQFADLRTQEYRRDQFDGLRQTKSVLLFYQKIKEKRIFLQPSPTDGDCLTLFRRGLKPEIRKRIEALPDHLLPSDFDKYAQFADKCERELYANVRRAQLPIYSGSTYRDKASRKPSVDADGDIEMTLNALPMKTASADKYTTPRAPNQAIRACYGCGAKDHLRRDCPKNPRKPKSPGKDKRR